MSAPATIPDPRPDPGATAGEPARPVPWWQSPTRLFLAFVLRPTARSTWWGVAVALTLLAIETAVVLWLKRNAEDNAFGALFLLGVLVVSAGWSFALALGTSLVSAVVYVYIHHEGDGALAPAVIVFLLLAFLANVLAGQARLRANESEERGRAAAAMATQQAALRAVATLVARGAQPSEVYPAAVLELARGLGVEHVALIRYDRPDGDPTGEHGEPGATVMANFDADGLHSHDDGERLELTGDSVAARVWRTGERARVDDYAALCGPMSENLRRLGMRSGAGTPIVVGGTVRAALVVGSMREEPLPADTEVHVGDFADLVATAIANAETHAELRASRARIVAAADQARRGFERDLHDGAQQRIVALGLGLRTIEASIPDDEQAVRSQLTNVIDGMAELYTDLQELSRGIHPAILSKGGLGPAVRSLTRRSTVPVALQVDVDPDVSVPETIGVAAYYVVAETLTNAAKHARAESISVRVHVDRADGSDDGGDVLCIDIADDGVGGAVPDGRPGRGSGLMGLKDRVEAVSGTLDVESPVGRGTAVKVRIPLRSGRPGCAS